MFTLYKARSSLDVESYRVTYADVLSKIAVNLRPEKVKIVVSAEAVAWESVPKCSGSGKEAAYVEFTSHEVSDMKGFSVAR